MNQHSILAFSIWTGIILLAMDVYVVGHWAAYVRRHNMNLWWHRVLWGAVVAMAAVYWYVVYRRHFFRLDGLDVALFGLVSFWSMPKIGIVLALLLRDVYRGAKHVKQWLLRKSLPDSVELDASQPEVPSASLSRRDFIGKAGWTMSMVPYAIVGNGMFSTIYDFQVYEVEVVLPNLPRAFDGMRIAQISDVHAGSFPDHRPMEEVRRIIHSQKPDAVMITGDFVNADPEELAVLGNQLEKIRAPHGVFATLGNHDHYNSPQQHRRLIEGVRERGVDLLINERRVLTAGSERLIIAGTDNTGFRQNYADIDVALGDATMEDAVILLAHDPTFWEKEVVGGPTGLMLAGHTHGGQFGVSLLGFEWSPAQYVYKQWAGLYAIGNQHIYVNRGIGTVGPPIRIGIPPEVTIITLRRSQV